MNTPYPDIKQENGFSHGDQVAKQNFATTFLTFCKEQFDRKKIDEMMYHNREIRLSDVFSRFYA